MNSSSATVETSRQRVVRLLVVLLLTLPVLFAAGMARSASAQDVASLQINSKRYIVTDSQTGEVYAQRNQDQEVAIGSLTKIFTGMEAMEIAPLDMVITTTDDDLLDPANNSLMGFDAGQKLTLRDLLYGMMLPSGNDAAHCVARVLGHRDGDTSAQQSIDRYMGWVNQRIADMGLTHTHLITPDGWGVPGHYTSAHDLAAFTRYAMENPFFQTLISTKTYTTTYGATLTNNNRLLGQYDKLLGGKTGYDWDAGWCLVEVGQFDGMTMISVTLDGIHDNMDWYDDDQVLLEYGFQQRAKTRSTTTKWTGNTALFTDPGIAVLDRSAKSTVAIGGIAAGAAANQTGTGTNGQTGATNLPANQTSLATASDGSDPAISGPVLARILLAIGITGLILLAAGFIYSRMHPAPTGGAPQRRPAPAGGASRRARSRPSASSPRAAPTAMPPTSKPAAHPAAPASGTAMSASAAARAARRNRQRDAPS